MSCWKFPSLRILQYNQVKGEVPGRSEQVSIITEVLMKGYNVESGYMGWLNGEYVLFSCEADYREAMEEE